MHAVYIPHAAGLSRAAAAAAAATADAAAATAAAIAAVCVLITDRQPSDLLFFLTILHACMHNACMHA